MKDKRLADNGPNVKAIFDTWIAAYDAEDLDKVMSVYDRATVFTEACVADKDYAALAAWFKFDFSRSGPRPHWTFKIDWTNASGDLAVVVSSWSGFTDFGTKVEAQVHGFRSMDVFRKSGSGWKIVRTFNETDNCCPDPTLAKKTKPRKKKQK
jgi:ketosteroid isomerase-like protein